MGVNTAKIEGRDKLIEEIKKLEGVDSVTGVAKLPEVKLRELSYFAPSDDSLKKVAERELADYRTAAEKSVRDGSAAETKSFVAKRDAVIADRDAELQSLDGRYAAAAKSIDDDAIRRGIARSSIAALGKSGLQSEYLRQNGEISARYAKAIAALDGEIASTGAKLDSALNDFNLSYATKLGQKLDELIAERDKKVAETIKYNNTVKESQAKLDADRAKTESSLNDAALDRQKKENALGDLPNEKREAVFKSVFERMDSFLSGMSPAEAKIELLNHSVYREHLSDYYYARLLDKYARV